MNNKYQEAIDIVARYCSDYRMGIFPSRHKLSNELDILKELVDRATPKKVKLMEDYYFPETNDYDYTSGYCPYCGTGVCRDETHIPNYCSNCGQKLLWDDE